MCSRVTEILQGFVWSYIEDHARARDYVAELAHAPNGARAAMCWYLRVIGSMMQSVIVHFATWYPEDTQASIYHKLAKISGTARPSPRHTFL